MSAPGPRSTTERRRDVLALLASRLLDGWVASGDGAGAHLVPLSVAWVGERLVLCLRPDSPTASNIRDRGRARIGMGPTRDVVMVDAELEEEHDPPDAPAAVVEGFAAQADWDPRDETGYRFMVLRPVRIQAWRDSAEIPGRTVMLRGAWKE